MIYRRSDMIRPGSVCTYNVVTNYVNCECPEGTVLNGRACEDEDLSKSYVSFFIIYKIDHQSFYILGNLKALIFSIIIIVYYSYK